jgi:hypothetical protein
MLGQCHARISRESVTILKYMACIAVHSRVLLPLQEMEHGYMQQLPVIKFPIRFKTEDVLRVLSRGNESKPHDR